MSDPYRILMVCMGNICRSPTAHGVLRDRLRAGGLAQRVEVDSAGTHGYHAGEPADARAQQHARRRGYDLSDLRSRRLRDEDFERHDLILVMDRNNLREVLGRCPAAYQDKVRRLTDFGVRWQHDEVPDPYYGGEAGFEQVLDLIEDACDGLLQHLAAHGAFGDSVQ